MNKTIVILDYIIVIGCGYMLCEKYIELIGHTPLMKLKSLGYKNINVYAKLEGYNPSGSVKDRSASYVIDRLLETGEIGLDTMIIESSSGNFGIALANYLKYKGMNFTCVIDPKITDINYRILSGVCDNIITAEKMDDYGGYLLERIRIVKEYVASHENVYWINQYANIYMKDAYYSVGNELIQELHKIDYVFLAVSSGGTIAGISNCIKDTYPNAKIVAVDIEGSIIFGTKPKKRNIPGIGSSQVPDILKYAKIDDVIIVNEEDSINACHQLVKEELILAGGSSGSIYTAIQQYFKDKTIAEEINVVTVFPDRGDRYIGTIY